MRDIIKLANKFISKYAGELPEDISKDIDDLLKDPQESESAKPEIPKPTVPAVSAPTKSKEINSNTYQSPIKGNWRIIGEYDPTGQGVRVHAGIDMCAPFGTPVYPMAAGKVVNAGNDPKGGLSCVIEHRKDLYTYYAHFETLNVKNGDVVDLETILGTVGDTGNAKGNWPHCHFLVSGSRNVLSNTNTPRDPKNFFPMPANNDLSFQKKYKKPANFRLKD